MAVAVPRIAVGAGFWPMIAYAGGSIAPDDRRGAPPGLRAAPPAAPLSVCFPAIPGVSQKPKTELRADRVRVRESEKERIVAFLGTRTSSRQPNGTPATRQLSRDFSEQDRGSLNQRIVTATFTAATARIAGSNGDFVNFAVGERFQVEGTVVNDGGYQVTAIDGANHAFVNVAPAPKDQGAISATLRKLIS
jgi:hypothetical protein